MSVGEAETHLHGRVVVERRAATGRNRQNLLRTFDSTRRVEMESFRQVRFIPCQCIVAIHCVAAITSSLLD